MDPTALIAIVVIAAAILLLSRRIASREPQRPLSAEDIIRRVQEDDFRASTERLLIEIEQSGREIIARIDTKVRFLEQLVRDADERIAKLEKLRDPADPARDDPRRARVSSLADQGKSAVEIAQETGLPTGEVELILSLRRQALEKHA